MSRFKPVFCLLILGLTPAPVIGDEDIFKIGVEALNKKQYRFAIVCFNDVLRKDPKNFEAVYYRGLAQSGKGFWESAINNFTEAIRLNPNHARAYVARGNAYVELKDYENAIQDHHQGLQLDPKFALDHINRGHSYAQIRNYRAVEDFSVATRVSPNDPLPHLDRRQSLP